MKLKTLLKTYEGALLVYKGTSSDSVLIGSIHSVGKNGYYANLLDFDVPAKSLSAKEIHENVDKVMDCQIEKCLIAGYNVLHVYLKNAERKK